MGLSRVRRRSTGFRAGQNRRQTPVPNSPCVVFFSGNPWDCPDRVDALRNGVATFRPGRREPSRREPGGRVLFPFSSQLLLRPPAPIFDLFLHRLSHLTTATEAPATAEDQWMEVLSIIRTSLSSHEFDTWFAPARFRGRRRRRRGNPGSQRHVRESSRGRIPGPDPARVRGDGQSRGLGSVFGLRERSRRFRRRRFPVRGGRRRTGGKQRPVPGGGCLTPRASRPEHRVAAAGVAERLPFRVLLVRFLRCRREQSVRPLGSPGLEQSGRPALPVQPAPDPHRGGARQDPPPPGNRPAVSGTKPGAQDPPDQGRHLQQPRDQRRPSERPLRFSQRVRPA